MADTVRVNVRVSSYVHDWFKDKSNRTGVSMSALMFLALEQHIQQAQVVSGIDLLAQDLSELKASVARIDVERRMG